MQCSQIRMKDIAEMAGVSVSTVSRCLNDSPLVSVPTKRKIMELAKEVGFEFNASARGLITHSVGTVGIILPDDFTKLSVQVYHGMLMNSLRDNLEELDVDLIVAYQRDLYTGQNRVVRLVNRRKVDGLIILSEGLDHDTASFLQEKKVPFVCIHYPPAGRGTPYDVVYTDHYVGGRLVAEHLVERGRKRFALFGMREKHLEFRLREKGFIDFLERAGYQVKRYGCDAAYESAYTTAKEGMEGLKRCDAVFGLNDLMSLGVLKAMKEEGLNVPGDIAVVGYDDSEYSRYSEPGLTSVHQPKEELSILACQRLFLQLERQKEGARPSRELIGLPPSLIVRDSS
ncbi:LacI family DNA-binding transcriptional regulator [Sediminispirochaeta smaragdinae]|uniref:Transcriptional regulator, LacI family n=1 Tax=Sediminispirochaeta smaragdinae (strain DSM 11293 / JCM 15392 / SEBR 4228) TaxID=573413 RepID=E1R4P0_SEDSS|nr:LacI family DNA-binding transcriptional regulator [Sediminispirochaeta smaragdinae]ADK82128.1 transcriptional regulator, LacI family [Sediminispirochaeta smaragdinae DSM 11293]